MAELRRDLLRRKGSALAEQGLLLNGCPKKPAGNDPAYTFERSKIRTGFVS